MYELERLDLSYLGISDNDQEMIASCIGSIKALISKTGKDIVKIGENLIRAKEIIGHGKFGIWLEKEFAWSERTARRFMNVAKHFKSDTVSDLKVSAKALYLLASPSTPDEVREKIISQGSEEEVSAPDVKQAIEEATEGPERKKPKGSGRKSNPIRETKPLNNIEKLNTAINILGSLAKNYQETDQTEKAELINGFINDLQNILQSEQDHRVLNENEDPGDIFFESENPSPQEERVYI